MSKSFATAAGSDSRPGLSPPGRRLLLARIRQKQASDASWLPSTGGTSTPRSVRDCRFAHASKHMTTSTQSSTSVSVGTAPAASFGMSGSSGGGNSGGRHRASQAVASCQASFMSSRGAIGVGGHEIPAAPIASTAREGTSLPPRNSRNFFLYLEAAGTEEFARLVIGPTPVG